MFVRGTSSISGTSLQIVLPDLSLAKVREIFGEPDKDAYYEPERGYDGNEYTFVDEVGNVARLYDRYGQFRIGARHGGIAMTFMCWLATQTKTEGTYQWAGV